MSKLIENDSVTIAKTGSVDDKKINIGGSQLNSNETTHKLELSHDGGVTKNVIATIDGTEQLSGKTFAQNIMPEATGTRDIGATGTKFKDLHLSGNANIGGDLNVAGTTTTVNSTTLEVTDSNITINNGGNDVTAEGAGITVERSGVNGSFVYEDALASKFKIGPEGSEKEIIDISSVQVVSNKSISASKIISKTDTDANLVTYAATATNGELLYASDSKKYYGVKDGALISIGGGGGSGGSAIYGALNADDDLISTWDTTNITNATFTEEASANLNGLKSFKLTNQASAANEYVISPTITVPQRAWNKENGIEFQYKYSGTANYIKAIFYDVTNSVSMGELLLTPTASFGKVVGYVLSSCTQVQIRFQIVTGEAATLVFDDIEFTDAPWKTIDLQYINSIKLEGNDGRTITADTEDIHFSGSGTGWTSTGDTHYYTVQKSDSVITVSTGTYFTTATGRAIALFKNGSEYKSLTVGSSTTENFCFGTYISKKGEFTVGDILSVRTNVSSTLSNSPAYHYLNIVETATTAHVISASKQALEEQVDLTVTGTNWTTTRAVGTYYTTVNGTHRLRFNIRGGISTAVSSITLTVSGVAFKVGYTNGQAVSAVMANEGVGYYSTIDSSVSGSAIYLYASGASNLAMVSGDVELDSKPTWGKTLESGLVVAMPAQRIAYVRVHATYENTYISSTTSYKTQTLSSVTGDSIGASVASNRLTLPAGKYALGVPVGAYSTTGWLSLQLYNTGTSSQIVELLNLIYNMTGDSIPFRDAHFTLTLTGVTTMEFRTKGASSGGDEYMGTIKITKLE